MSVTFESSHLSEDFAAGRLEVGVWIDDAAAGFTRHDALWFEVPPDYHVHNDSIAAALLTLVGGRQPRVRFNFPISSFCAATLRAHYGLAEVGPVNPGLAPRGRGRWAALLLSGGLDSLAMWALLRRALGDGNFRVVTTDFGGQFAFEARGFRAVPRDITCRTNFRELGYDQAGRFTGAVALLFADYLDLASVVTGHHANHPPASFEPLLDDRPPAYLANDPPFEAGGLGELHIARALFAPATPWILVQGDSALLAAGWLGSSPDGTVKQFKKGLLLRHLFERAGRPAPHWLARLPPPRRQERLLQTPDTLGLSLYLVKHCGMDALRPLYYDIDRHDLAFVERLALTFLDRHDTNVTGRLPAALQGPVLDAFAAFDIAPYDERDWRERRQLGELIAAAAAQPRQRLIGVT